MSKSLKDYVIEYSNEKGYSLEEEFLYETFEECLSEEVISEKIYDSLRWYDIHKVVHKVTIDNEVRFFETYCYHTTGDLSPSDMDLDEITLDSIREVYPEEVTVTVYK